MKQTVHFSKTERLSPDSWEATVSPADVRKGLTLKEDDIIEDMDFLGEISSVNKGVVTFFCIKGFPCVGREYKIERK